MVRTDGLTWESLIEAHLRTSGWNRRNGDMVVQSPPGTTPGMKVLAFTHASPERVPTSSNFHSGRSPLMLAPAHS